MFFQMQHTVIGVHHLLQMNWIGAHVHKRMIGKIVFVDFLPVAQGALYFGV